MEKNKFLKNIERTNIKSETQEKNWVSIEEIRAKREELGHKVDTFKNAKELKDLKETQYNTLLEYVVLSLYTLIPPRRNEYNNMFIILKYSDEYDDDFNYYSLSNQKFIFNKFKNVKKVGRLDLDVPKDLQNVLDIYIKFHPHLHGKKLKKDGEIPFLVYYDGTEFNKTNSITRVLNKIFGKNLSSSLIRHIFLSDKYLDVMDDMKKDSIAMSHSTSMQADYIKKD
jgi:hypothetical protein